MSNQKMDNQKAMREKESFMIFTKKIINLRDKTFIFTVFLHKKFMNYSFLLGVNGNYFFTDDAKLAKINLHTAFSS